MTVNNRDVQSIPSIWTAIRKLQKGGPSGDSVILKVEKIYSSAELATSNTPIEILPTPAAGTYYQPVAMSVAYKAGTIPFDTAAYVSVTYDNNSSYKVTSNSNMGNTLTNKIQLLLFPSLLAVLPTRMTLSTTANLLNGDGSISFTMSYMICKY